MFQIIHDLKNPTISLKNGTELAEEKLSLLDVFKNCQNKMVIFQIEVNKIREKAKNDQ